MLLARTGRPDEATDHWLRSIAAGTEDVSAYLNLAAVLSAGGQDDRARTVLQQALRIDPGNARLRQLLAR